MEVKFLPGCFDDFQGSQEELDELVKSIEEQFKHAKSIEDLDVVEEIAIGADDVDLVDDLLANIRTRQ